MRVVAGKPTIPDADDGAFIRFAALNPYWNAPPDLTAERIAPNVLKQGVELSRPAGYQVLSDWTDHPESSIRRRSTGGRWPTAGEVRIRQLPGPANSMGRMKFMFPNAAGHLAARHAGKANCSRRRRGCTAAAASGSRTRRGSPAGCSARDLDRKGAGPRRRSLLDKPVPVYITYLTAVPSGSAIAYFDDVYGRDRRGSPGRRSRRRLAAAANAATSPGVGHVLRDAAGRRGRARA